MLPHHWTSRLLCNGNLFFEVQSGQMTGICKILIYWICTCTLILYVYYIYAWIYLVEQLKTGMLRYARCCDLKAPVCQMLWFESPCMPDAVIWKPLYVRCCDLKAWCVRCCDLKAWCVRYCDLKNCLLKW